MTGASSKLLQIEGKWHQERKPNKNHEAKKYQKGSYILISHYLINMQRMPRYVATLDAKDLSFAKSDGEKKEKIALLCFTLPTNGHFLFLH